MAMGLIQKVGGEVTGRPTHRLFLGLAKFACVSGQN